MVAAGRFTLRFLSFSRFLKITIHQPLTFCNRLQYQVQSIALRSQSIAGRLTMVTGIIEKLEDVTPTVLRAMSGADNARLRTVMEAFVRHMHAFAREVNLTEEEYDLGIDFLNRIGQATHDSHNEGILFADAIGFSTLVCMLNNGNDGATETAAALLGPFWRANSPRTASGGSIVRSPTPGPELFATCEIVDAAGNPLA